MPAPIMLIPGCGWPDSLAIQLIRINTVARSRPHLLISFANTLSNPERLPDEFGLAQAKHSKVSGSRLRRHRTRVNTGGSKRVEVTVPSRDAALLKAIAGVLRMGGKDAKHVRDSLEPIIALPKARTGSELVEFFRQSPLVDADLQFERDASTDRSPDLG